MKLQILIIYRSYIKAESRAISQLKREYYRSRSSEFGVQIIGRIHRSNINFVVLHARYETMLADYSVMFNMLNIITDSILNYERAVHLGIQAMNTYPNNRIVLHAAYFLLAIRIKGTLFTLL